MKTLGELAAEHGDHNLFRFNLIMCLYGKTAPEEWKEPAHWLVRSARERWGDVLLYGRIGPRASQFTTMSNAKWRRVTSEIDAAGEKELTFFKVRGAEQAAPDVEILLRLNPACADPDYDGANVVQLVWPVPDSMDEVDASEAYFYDVFAHFQGSYGYAAPAIVFAKESVKFEAGREMAPLALRHIGLDVPNNEWAHAAIGFRARGARWLTFLSALQLAELGPGALDNPPEPVTVRRGEDWAIVKASPEPEVGDVNRLDIPAGLVWVDRVLKPISKFGDRYLKPVLGDNMDVVERWERRFEELQ